MPVTLAQIAEHCGLSTQTVSRILNHKEHDKYLPETRERVERAAQELGYMPNSSARAISTGRFGAIALLLNTSQHLSAMPHELFSGISTALHNRDLHLMVAQLPDTELTSPGFMPKVLREWTVDGLLINYSQCVPATMLARIQAHTLPSIWTNLKQETNSVYPDDFGAGYAATEHLLRLGHRRIVYVTDQVLNSAHTHYSVYDRQAGYEAAMQAAGLKPQIFEENYWSAGGDAMNQQRMALLTSGSRPTALVGYCHHFLQPLVQCACSLGWQVPQHLSVVAFEADAIRHWPWNTELTLWKIPNNRMGQGAVEMLLARIKHPDQIQTSRSIPFTLIPGTTCAPPPGAD